jgi:hypothetical protein
MSHENPNRPNGEQQFGVPQPASAASKRTSVLGAWGARVVLIVVAVCALVSVVFILFGAGGDTLGRVITTDIALIVFALLVWLDTVIGTYREEWFEFASLATDAYLLLLWITTIWTENGSGPFALWIDIWRAILCLIFVRGMLALVDLVRFLYSRWVTPVTRALAYVSGISFAVTGVMVTIPAPSPFNGLWDVDYYGRVIAAIAVIAGVALVLIPLWGLLVNRNNRVRRTARYGYPGGPSAPYGAPHAGAAYGVPYTTAATAGVPVAGAPLPGAQAGVVPDVAPVPQAPTPGVQTGGYPPVPQPPASQSPAPGSDPTGTAHLPAPAPTPGRPSMAWPRLANGAPVPADASGAPDFAAVAGATLAWPSFADGRPVPAAPDGSPLYR